MYKQAVIQTKAFDAVVIAPYKSLSVSNDCDNHCGNCGQCGQCASCGTGNCGNK